MSEGIVVGRRRRSRVEAERLVVEFERSGRSRRAFCEQHGLSVPSLDQYRKRCQAAGAPSKRAHAVEAQAVANRILPVEFVDAGILAAVGPRPLRVELANGRRIEVAPGFDASTLERRKRLVLAVLMNGVRVMYPHSVMWIHS